MDLLYSRLQHSYSFKVKHVFTWLNSYKVYNHVKQFYESVHIKVKIKHIIMYFFGIKTQNLADILWFNSFVLMQYFPDLFHFYGTVFFMELIVILV